MVFANEDSPVYMMGGFDLMAALLDNQPKVRRHSSPAPALPGAIRPAACSAR